MRVLELGVRPEKRFYLGLDHLLQHAARPIPQHQQQRIIGDTRPWPRQANNGIPLHGVSFRVTSNITEDTPPQPSSTKFEHSSIGPWANTSPTSALDGVQELRRERLARRKRRGTVPGCARVAADPTTCSTSAASAVVVGRRPPVSGRLTDGRRAARPPLRAQIPVARRHKPVIADQGDELAAKGQGAGQEAP
jgi:hypothetical protein